MRSDLVGERSKNFTVFSRFQRLIQDNPTGAELNMKGLVVFHTIKNM